MVFVNMATLKPKAGRENDPAELIKGFRDPMRGQPGLVETYLLKERGQGRLVGISIWETEPAFEKAMERGPTPSPQTSPGVASGGAALDATAG